MRGGGQDPTHCARMQRRVHALRYYVPWLLPRACLSADSWTAMLCSSLPALLLLLDVHLRVQYAVVLPRLVYFVHSHSPLEAALHLVQQEMQWL